MLEKAVLSWFESRGVLNFKKSHVDVYKCLPLIVGFTITVATWLREVVCCRDFILRAVTTFWAMSLVGIYPGRASDLLLCCTVGIVHCPFHLLYHVSWWLNPSKKGEKKWFRIILSDSHHTLSNSDSFTQLSHVKMHLTLWQGSYKHDNFSFFGKSNNLVSK